VKGKGLQMDEFQRDASFNEALGYEASLTAAVDQLLAETHEMSGGAAGAELRYHIRALRVRVGQLEERIERLEGRVLG
jgi:uncharacterized protein YceH (UPF0502 family)